MMRKSLFWIVCCLLILVFYYNTDKKLQEVKNQNIQLSARNEYRFIGYVINKVEENDKYYLKVVGYGKIEVSEVEYYEVIQGEPCPEFIKERGTIHD